MNQLTSVFIGVLLAAQAQANFTAHEWGTFTSVVGSNGEVQNGMIQEDEVLPDFVYNFGDENWPSSSREQIVPIMNFQESPAPPGCVHQGKIPCDYQYGQIITQKMETPVVYFYADHAQEVRFEVSFPDGVISQSFPAPRTTHPLAQPGVSLRGGYADYRFEILEPASSALPPVVDAESIYGHARNTHSNLIRSGSEVEKFIFYRGVGDFNPRLSTTSIGKGLTLKNTSAESISAAFIVYTEASGAGSIQAVGSLPSGSIVNYSSEQIQSVMKTLPQANFISEARRELVSALTLSGLFHDEAVAMVDTWEAGYFKTPGLRVLYVLPRSEVDQILPVTMTPAPKSFVRVFVGRIEVLLEDQETKILSDIMILGEAYPIESLGSLSLPVLNRMRAIALESGVLSSELDLVFEALVRRIQAAS